MSSLTTSTAWTALKTHHDEPKNILLRDSFNTDGNRHTKFSLHFNDILFDYSKNRITDQTLPLLIDLANMQDWTQNQGDVFRGENK